MGRVWREGCFPGVFPLRPGPDCPDGSLRRRRRDETCHAFGHAFWGSEFRPGGERGGTAAARAALRGIQRGRREGQRLPRRGGGHLRFLRGVLRRRLPGRGLLFPAGPGRRDRPAHPLPAGKPRRRHVAPPAVRAQRDPPRQGPQAPRRLPAFDTRRPGRSQRQPAARCAPRRCDQAARPRRLRRHVPGRADPARFGLLFRLPQPLHRHGQRVRPRDPWTIPRGVLVLPGGGPSRGRGQAPLPGPRHREDGQPEFPPGPARVHRRGPGGDTDRSGPGHRGRLLYAAARGYPGLRGERHPLPGPPPGPQVARPPALPVLDVGHREGQDREVHQGQGPDALRPGFPQTGRGTEQVRQLFRPVREGGRPDERRGRPRPALPGQGDLRPYPSAHPVEFTPGLPEEGLHPEPLQHGGMAPARRSLLRGRGLRLRDGEGLLLALHKVRGGGPCSASPGRPGQRGGRPCLPGGG